jgi:hypothetical protein
MPRLQVNTIDFYPYNSALVFNHYRCLLTEGVLLFAVIPGYFHSYRFYLAIQINLSMSLIMLVFFQNLIMIVSV